MSDTHTQQTVWESVRSYLSFVTPVAQLLIAVIVYYYTRDTSSTAESLHRVNVEITEVKTLLIKQDKDMVQFKDWMPKVNDNLDRVKEDNHRLELEIERLKAAVR